MVPYVGRRHDAGIFHDSRITEQLQRKQNDDGSCLSIFGDSASPLRCNYKNKKKMSSQIIFVEWGFDEVLEYFS